MSSHVWLSFGYRLFLYSAVSQTGCFFIKYAVFFHFIKYLIHSLLMCRNHY